MAKNPQAKTPTAREQMLRGSAWMTAGSILSRVLGAIYIIPWRIWLGAAFLAANNLFTKGYNIYSIFLTIATAGVPGAISKQVAHYNAMNEYQTGIRLFKQGTILMGIMGLLSFALMWVLAPWLALNDQALTQVYRSLAWPLLIIPVMSIMRGFFQGYNDMAPSALSQLIEQIARVIYMLGMTYAIMVLGSRNYVDAASQSTFAAFIGAIFGLLLLVMVLAARRDKYRALVAGSTNAVKISTRHILREIIEQAVPFIIIGSGINLYYLFDQYTFNPMMASHWRASTTVLNSLFTLFAGNANKLIMIVISLAVAMSSTVLPLLSGAKTRGNVREIGEQVTNLLQLFFIVMVPCALGMAAVAEPLYVVFYSYDRLGIRLLVLSAFVAVAMGLFTVLAAALQGLFHNRLAIYDMLVGMLVKIVLQWPLIYFFHVWGPLVATMAGMLVSSALMIRALHRRYPLRLRQTAHRLLGITAFAALMAVFVRLTVWLVGLVVSPERALGAVVALLIAVPVGVLIYGYALLKTRLADMVLGARIGRLRTRLHMR
ncbi:polysaccharide biosynthesis C-terminal domain-containing protein [Lacticaseibacillus jixianensis]|uniref:Polysaccharide biosynthesis C-terminal domain-containing protein n=1 Tax=Lacticaseibacillus jixianensis TaxID=2486012 RepID=A0ABW4BA36_9LACO|nr:polysaccharide biosynthesis protein [Lacticaseibacillus jixianensis]